MPKYFETWTNNDIKIFLNHNLALQTYVREGPHRHDMVFGSELTVVGCAAPGAISREIPWSDHVQQPGGRPMAPRGPPLPSRMHGIRSEALRGLDPMIRVLAADASESVTSRGDVGPDAQPTDRHARV